MSIVPIQYPIGKEDSFNGIIDLISEKARMYSKNGREVDIIDIPAELKEKVNELKEMLIEAVAETDENLLDKYFKEGTDRKSVV